MRAYLLPLSSGAVMKYCDEHVCLSVCLSAIIFPDHTCDLYQFLCECFLWSCMARSSSGKVTKSQGKGQFCGLFPHWQCIVTRSLQKRSAGKGVMGVYSAGEVWSTIIASLMNWFQKIHASAVTLSCRRLVQPSARSLLVSNCGILRAVRVLHRFSLIFFTLRLRITFQINPKLPFHDITITWITATAYQLYLNYRNWWAWFCCFGFTTKLKRGRPFERLSINRY